MLDEDARVLLPEAEYQRMAEVVAAARRSARGTVERPLHLVLPNQTLYLLIKTTVLRMKPVVTWAVVMVLEDLTELERAQRLAAWREVARRIAHEVKNPLTPIKLAAQRLQRRYADRLAKTTGSSRNAPRLSSARWMNSRTWSTPFPASPACPS